MVDDNEPLEVAASTVKPISHSRVLVLMAVIGIVGAIFVALTFSARSGAGILIGTVIAFANYYWLKGSLAKIFAGAARGERPRMLAGTYFLRYLILGVVVALLFIWGIVPIASIIIGMAAFGFAIVAEGIIRIISSFFSN